MYTAKFLRSKTLVSFLLLYTQAEILGVSKITPHLVNVYILLQSDSLHLLREEAQVLSRVKHEVEQHLQAVKNHLQHLDATRKSLRAKINSFSHNLGLDAQSFKVRGGEVYVCLRVDGKELTCLSSSSPSCTMVPWQCDQKQ